MHWQSTEILRVLASHVVVDHGKQQVGDCEEQRLHDLQQPTGLGWEAQSHLQSTEIATGPDHPRSSSEQLVGECKEQRLHDVQQPLKLLEEPKCTDNQQKYLRVLTTRVVVDHGEQQVGEREEQRLHDVQQPAGVPGEDQLHKHNHGVDSVQHDVQNRVWSVVVKLFCWNLTENVVSTFTMFIF